MEDRYALSGRALNRNALPKFLAIREPTTMFIHTNNFFLRNQASSSRQANPLGLQSAAAAANARISPHILDEVLTKLVKPIRDKKAEIDTLQRKLAGLKRERQNLQRGEIAVEGQEPIKPSELQDQILKSKKTWRTWFGT